MKYMIAAVVGSVIGFVGMSSYWLNVLRPRGADAEGALFIVVGVGAMVSVAAVLITYACDRLRRA